MNILTDDRSIIDYDDFHKVDIVRCEDSDDNPDNPFRNYFKIVAFGRKNIQDCVIIGVRSYNDAVSVILDLFRALRDNAQIWDASKVLSAVNQTVVTLELVKCVDDPKTGTSVNLMGATLSGTLLQVGAMFAVLTNSPTDLDVGGSPDNVAVWRASQEALEHARKSPLNPDGSLEYLDPNVLNTV